MGSEHREQHEAEPKPMTVYFDLMRHGNRFAGKGEWIDAATGEKVTWDDSENLTPGGKETARAYGANLPDADFVVGVSSVEPRAGETAEDVKEGAGQERGLGTNHVIGMTYKELGPEAMRSLKKAKPLIEQEAAKHPNYGRLTPEMRSQVRENAQATGFAEIMNDPAFMQEAAEGVAYNIHALREIAKAAAPDMQGKKVAMPVVGHGCFNEAFLQKVLIVRDAEGNVTRGFKEIGEIGGFFQPAESFRITSAQTGKEEKVECGFTNPDRQKLFEGKTLSIDWAKVEELAGEYEKRLAAKAA